MPTMNPGQQERELVYMWKDELAELRAENERMRKLLEWLNRRGGLGYEAHDRIDAVLKLKG